MPNDLRLEFFVKKDAMELDTESVYLKNVTAESSLYISSSLVQNGVKLQSLFESCLFTVVMPLSRRFLCSL